MSRDKRHKQKARQPTAVQSPPVAGLSVMRQILNTGYSESGASYRKGSLAGWRPDRSSPQSDIDVNLPMTQARLAGHLEQLIK